MFYQFVFQIDVVVNLQLCCVVVVVFIGIIIEWYDFYIYGFVVVFVFGKVFFFKMLDLGIVMLLLFVMLWVGFVVWFIGGIIFGYLGDKIGCKIIFIIMFILMGVVMMGIGLFLGYVQIGMWVLVGLVVLCVIQGVVVGGEWGGVVLIVSESVFKCKSILYLVFVQQGLFMGNLFVMLVFFVLSVLLILQFMLWGWCVFFLLLVLLVIVGMVICLKLEELDDMKCVLVQKKIVKLLFKDVVCDYWGFVLLGVGMLLFIYVMYLKSNFVFVWVMKELGYVQDIFFGIIVIVLVVQFIMQLIGVWLVLCMDMCCVICFMVLLEFLFMLVMFFVIEIKVYWIVLFGMCLVMILYLMFYGVIGGILVCVFLMCICYMGLLLVYQLCLFVVGGGMFVFVQWMFNSSGNIVGVVVFLVLYVLVLLVCMLVLFNCMGYCVDELFIVECVDVMDFG